MGATQRDANTLHINTDGIETVGDDTRAPTRVRGAEDAVLSTCEFGDGHRFNIVLDP